MKEIWKDIEGFEGFYQVSNLGSVRSLDRVVICKNGREKKLKGKVLKNQSYTNGYLFVALGGYKQESIHRLVAKSFINNPFNKNVVNHINGIKKDNRLENLEWVSDSENQIHAIENGLIQSSLSKDIVLEIRKNKKDSQRKLAIKYGVDSSTICRIRTLKTYKHL